jgi:hypothetical protein
MLSDDDVHYRLYRGPRDEQPTVICVQWFDYYDYAADRFLTEDRYADEADAEAALADYVARTKPTVTVVPVFIIAPVPVRS